MKLKQICKNITIRHLASLIHQVGMTDMEESMKKMVKEIKLMSSKMKMPEISFHTSSMTSRQNDYSFKIPYHYAIGKTGNMKTTRIMNYI